MINSFTTATAVAATALVALGSAAGAGPAPVQLAQMNVAPKIQPAPPPNLARPPVIMPRIDTSRLTGDEDDERDERKDAAGSREQIPQETATGGATGSFQQWRLDSWEQVPQETATGEVPGIAAAERQSPPPAAGLMRAPLPPVKPDLFDRMGPAELIDARGAAEAREAAEAAAAAGVGVERSDLSGLGVPGAGDDGADPNDPRLGGLTPEEHKERFGLGGASPEEIGHGLATEFNDLGNRGVSSPAGDVAAGLRPDPSSIPKGGLASDETGDEGTIYLRPTFFLNRTEDTGWQPLPAGGSIRTVTEYDTADRVVSRTTTALYDNGNKSEAREEYDPEGDQTFRQYVMRDKDGNVIQQEREGTPRAASGEGVAELQTREGASGGIGGCLPSDGSAACNELRRLQREGNTPGGLLAGSTLVNPGDADAGETGSGPRLIMGEDDLLGNPDLHRTEGGGGSSARSFDGGTLINPPNPNE